LRVSRRALVAIAAAGISIGVSSAVAGPVHAAAGVSRAAARPAATAYSTAGVLYGASAVANGSAWAVGYAGKSSAPKILMLHWNGKAWSRVASPGVLTRAGELNAITVVNAKDAWAAGFTGGFTNTTRRTLLLHWNGRAWSEVTRPAPIPGFLNAVAATASGGWAVGGVPNGHNWPHPLALRLSGTTWSRVPVPLVLEVTGVAITGTNAAWAIGATEQQFKFARWNGRKWAWEFSITPVQDTYILGGIAAGPRGAAFTVGYEFPAGGPQVPAILKLAGSTWKKVPVKAPSNAVLSAVSFAPGGTAWAAGSTGLATLILRWNGSAWTRVASPSPGSGDTLDGLGFSSARDGWAVGSSGSDTLILHWNGSTWK
jgi:hypothetical protein